MYNSDTSPVKCLFFLNKFISIKQKLILIYEAKPRALVEFFKYAALRPDLKQMQALNISNNLLTKATSSKSKFSQISKHGSSSFSAFLQKNSGL